jgi:hypothetical protein
MMESLSNETVHQLMSKAAVAPVVTIYAPMHRSAAPPNMTEDQIRLKNLINQAAHKLATLPNGERLAKALRRKYNELLSDRSFWDSQTDGLLICATPDFIRLFQLPIDTAEHVTVNERFHLAPIFSLLADQQSFYTLVLAQHNPRLYKADLYGLHDAGLELPANLETALGIDENNQKSEQGRSSSGSDGDTANFNGRVDAEISEYRELSKYQHILPEHLAGNYTDIPEPKLFDHALRAFRQSVVMHEHEAVLDRYERVHGTNPQLAANDDMAAAAAAEEGRVDTLVVGMSRFTTDSVRDNMEPTTVLEFSDDNDDELVNQTAQLVWSSGGRVVNIESEKLPLNVRMHAILRY